MVVLEEELQVSVWDVGPPHTMKGLGEGGGALPGLDPGAPHKQGTVTHACNAPTLEMAVEGYSVG